MIIKPQTPKIPALEKFLRTFGIENSLANGIYIQFKKTDKAEIIIDKENFRKGLEKVLKTLENFRKGFKINNCFIEILEEAKQNKTIHLILTKLNKAAKKKTMQMH